MTRSGLSVVAGMDPRLPLAEVGAYAGRVEALGFDALHVPETVNDSLVVAALALEHTSTLVVRTSVTVAFVRSPMQLALTAWSLAALAPGRFALGLGSQIRANIEQRHGMIWSEPVAHMAEVITAIGACFDAFASGGPLDHRGSRYRLTRLQAEFRPDPLPCSPPEIWLGAVNAGMSELAGRMADGVISHPTNSVRSHLDDVMVPSIARGAATAGRSVPPLIVAPPVVTGPDPASVASNRAARLDRLATVLSTPAYEPTLARIGHREVAQDLRRAIREGRTDLATLVPDAVVDQLAVVAVHDDLAALLHDRYGEVADGVLLRPPDDAAQDHAFADVVAALRERT
ncbi:MAG: LLM class flavin-dependent oxidoreductase [Acidimicrobiales bacterium]